MRANNTPANWELGDDVIIPDSISNEEASRKFPQGFKNVTTYLRYTSILSNNY
ncbi:hypothetical protein [Fulvivirga ligni]|uniref:hypothetical protein n=1 Tax=Fulvivirga ligni TaxID=2904246 RepID=UPI003F8FCC52